MLKQGMQAGCPLGIPRSVPPTLTTQKRHATWRSFTIVGRRLQSEWFARSPYQAFALSQRYGPDKGFFHRDNSQYTTTLTNPNNFLFPGGKVISPAWQTDPGIQPHDRAGEVVDYRLDSVAYKQKLEHNHPELTWDQLPTPFGCYDFDFSLRGGMVGVKIGKVTQIDDYGNMHNATILWCPEQYVVGHRTHEADGRAALLVGAYPTTRAKGMMADMCGSAGVPQLRVFKEFRISEDAYIPIGTKLDVRHFVPGQLVDIKTRTIERGFQGVIQRWGFKGGPHTRSGLAAKAWRRRPGSINHSETAKVMKGKKMPGHMGGLLRTSCGGWVWRVDFKNQLVYILGSIPGAMGQFVTLSDSSSRRFDFFYGPPPFPTFTPKETENVSKMSWDECQLISRSRVGFPREMKNRPPTEILDSVNYANKQKALMMSESFNAQ